MSRFNLSRFNLPDDADSLVTLQTYALETFTGIFTVSDIRYMAQNAAAAMQSSAALTAGVLLRNRAEAAFDGAAHLLGIWFAQGDCVASVAALAAVGADCRFRADAGGQVDAAVAISSVLHLQESALTAAGFTGELGADYYSHSLLYEILSAMCDVQATDFHDITIDVTLKPGDRLVIDSENFVVLLNGENITEKHAGQWANLNRNVYDIQVDSGSSSVLNTHMLYTERYL